MIKKDGSVFLSINYIMHCMVNTFSSGQIKYIMCKKDISDNTYP